LNRDDDVDTSGCRERKRHIYRLFLLIGKKGTEKSIIIIAVEWNRKEE
jgi:hypothetical protein